MRRMILAIALVLVPGLAIAPALVGASGAKPAYAARHTPAPERQPHKKCVKGHTKKVTKCKPAAKKAPTKPVPKRPKPPKAPKAPRSTPVPTRTQTPVPTLTATSTATATATATVVPTFTLTPTPEPSIAQIDVQSGIPIDYRAAFYVCGLPAGVTASFAPNPVTSIADAADGTKHGAHTTLTLASQWNTTPNTYGLSVRAYFQDPSGHATSVVLGGAVEPHAVLLTVDNNHHSTVKAVPDVLPTGSNNCSAVPPDFIPTPPPTPSASEIVVTSSVSNAHPARDETVRVTGRIVVRGYPQAGVLVHFAWYGPYAVPGCDAYTDENGTASCSAVNANPLPGYNILVQVTFKYNNQTYTSYVSYTM